MQPYELRAEQLHHVCDDSLLDFETTYELPDQADILGQERALGALHLGVGLRHEGLQRLRYGFARAEQARHRPQPAATACGEAALDIARTGAGDDIAADLLSSAIGLPGLRA